MSSSLWIRSSQTSNARSMLQNWLKTIDYESLSGVGDISTDTASDRYTVYNLSGARVLNDAYEADGLATGVYIVNGKKMLIQR